MSDDSFIREVNDEMRREQAQKLWDRFGPALLGIAILVVLGTAAFVGYRYWDETRANRSGDAFSQALKLANDGKNDDALAALDQLEKDGYGAYPLLARMLRRGSHRLRFSASPSGSGGAPDREGTVCRPGQAGRDSCRGSSNRRGELQS